MKCLDFLNELNNEEDRKAALDAAYELSARDARGLEVTVEHINAVTQNLSPEAKEAALKGYEYHLTEKLKTYGYQGGDRQ